MDGFAGDGEMGDEVGVVAGHGVLDDGIEGVAGGVVEEETDEDDQERVEDVVGEIHVLCIDADFGLPINKRNEKEYQRRKRRGVQFGFRSRVDCIILIGKGLVIGTHMVRSRRVGLNEEEEKKGSAI